MIRNRTTFVLGAGASAPYGYPLGGALRDEIARCEPRMLDALVKAGHEKKLIEHFCSELSLANLPSIDTFLERQHSQDLIEIGRTAIAWAITEHELNANLSKSDWMQYVYHQMIDGAKSLDDFRKNNVSIVTFNYDTSVERFFVNSLRAAWGVTLDEAKLAFVNTVNVVHIYGKLPDRPAGSKLEPLGNGVHELRQAASEIKVLHEGEVDSPAFDEARRLISNSRLLLFMGFGFLRDNVDRLRLDQCCTEHHPDYFHCTAFQLTDNEVSKIRRMLPRSRQVLFTNHECHDHVRNVVDLFDCPM